MDHAAAFERLFREVEPRLRRAFVGTHGIDRAGDAAAEAMAWRPSPSTTLRGLDTDVLYLYDAVTERWTDSGLVVEGWNPLLSVFDGRVLLPDEADPMVGTLP